MINKLRDAAAQESEALPLISPESMENQTEPSSQPHFSLNTQGVFHHTDENSRWICSPLTIKALIRDKPSEKLLWLSFACFLEKSKTLICCNSLSLFSPTSAPLCLTRILLVKTQRGCVSITKEHIL